MLYLAGPAAFVSLALAPLVVGLAVCSSAVAQTVTVDKETVASAVSDQLAKQAGRSPYSATCTWDLVDFSGTPTPDSRGAVSNTLYLKDPVSRVKRPTTNSN